MAEFKQIIDDALDILKFDGAVQDTLAELREKWGAQVPALLDERFDAVGVQYMKLSHEKGAAALGQELSAFGWALYNLDDEDEYLFALIPEEERSEWERYCKKQGQYCHLMKQQGRKWGDHAKEQDPGKLMPCEEYILQDEYDYFFNSRRMEKRLCGRSAPASAPGDPRPQFAAPWVPHLFCRKWTLCRVQSRWQRDYWAGITEQESGYPQLVRAVHHWI